MHIGAPKDVGLHQTVLTNLYQNDFLNFFAKDRRFRDPSWQDNSFFQTLKDSYLAYQNFIITAIDNSDLPFWEKRKTAFWSKLFLDAYSPSNFPTTNPEVLRQSCVENGQNFMRGIQNFWSDMAHNPNFLPPLTDTDAFRLGENIANTPGSVVFQNDLFQLILYHPTQPTTHASPLLLIPAWINKYYLFDLSEEKSFIRYNLEKGRTVFCLSWVNPTSQLPHLTLRDYLDQGIETAIQQTQRINQEHIRTSTPQKINVVAMCVGGTFLLTKLAEEIAQGKELPIRSISLLMTPFDFQYLEWAHLFMTPQWIQSVRKHLASTPPSEEGYGIMVGETLTKMFCILRANDLIWPNYVERYLLGNKLSPIDFLYWNHDAPRIALQMLCEYIELFFFQNAFVSPPSSKWSKNIQNGLSQISQPIFIFGTERDHLVPWESCYAAARALPHSRFILGGAGHVVGCINPPSAQRYHYYMCPENSSEAYACGPLEWLHHAEKFEGSWWPAWNDWLEPFCGDTAPSFLPHKHEIIEPAPGTYAL